MAVIRLSGFNGENRAAHPSLLPENIGVQSTNQKPGRGDLRSWKTPHNVATVPSGRKTIYRMGRDKASDTNYWLSWPGIVHAVRGPNTSDSAERTYFTGDGTPKWTDTAVAISSTSNAMPTAAYRLGVPAPATACVLTAAVTTSPTTSPTTAPVVVTPLVETRAYTYTYVNSFGEESAPNPAPPLIVCNVGASVTISSLAPPPSGNFGVSRIRIYRTQSDSSGAGAFYFLTEISSSATSAVDNGQILGEIMPSATWLMPEATMTNLTGLWNGMMAGIYGRSVRFCEAFKPYAWPMAYEVLPTSVTPVALCTYGQTLVVLTNGSPLIITLRINGGTNGQAERVALHAKALEVLA